MQTPSDTVGSNSCEDVITDFMLTLGALKGTEACSQVSRTQTS